MNAKARNCLSALVATVVCSVLPVQAASSPALAPAASPGFVNAAQFGFSPTNSGLENTKALQRAVDRTGTIIVSEPGTYNIGGTVFIGSHTALVFGHNVFLKKVNEAGEFTHVLLNKGALTNTSPSRASRSSSTEWMSGTSSSTACTGNWLFST